MPLKITETIVADQDALVNTLRARLLQGRSGEGVEAAVPTAEELRALVEQVGPDVQALTQKRAELLTEHARMIDEFFK